ncbi:cell division protein FtsK [Brachybacterium endophyticum]|uniref:Cell division protein FtsK n=1 Tax=Brachybacterium endophyticum TaxID=2182385 RepID=A0A2U2RGN4_9MICO|nr:FtsK/SpoIIIE domain-containing protein [Brachybacterium endophyticum]PWH05033.1 cell division protein FtsK [Brachybacterium endophyticum]
MRIKLTLRRPEDRLTDLEVTADATASVADVANALYLADPLRSVDEAPEGLTLQVQDPGAGPGTAGVRSLNRGADLIEAGLRSGAVVSIARSSEQYATRSEARGAPVALLRVLSGPEEGREFPLPSGSSVIGREGDIDIRIADAMLSKRHARINVADAVEIVDLRSSNGVLISGEKVEQAVVGPADTVEVGGTTFSIIMLHRAGGGAQNSPVVEFNRSPRVVPRFEYRELTPPQPPREPTPQFFPIFMMFAPLLMGGLMFAVTRSPYSLIFVFMMPMMATAGYLNRKYQNRKQLERSIRNFEEGLASLKRRVTAAQDLERAVRLVETPSTADAVDSAYRLGRLLWTHRPEHEAFTTVRLGLGVAESRVAIPMPGENDTIAKYWDQLEDMHEEYRTIAGVPVVGDLRESGGIGVAGGGEQADAVARGLVTQLFALHSPTDLAIAALTSRSSRRLWEWLKWLPHTSSPHSPLPGDHMADGPTSGLALISRIEELIEERSGGEPPALRRAVRVDISAEPEQAPDPVTPNLVLVVEDDAPVDRARLVRIAERGPDVGVFVIWSAPNVAALPAACRTYLSSEENVEGASAGIVRRGERYYPVSVETLALEAAAGVARHLSPVIDAGVPIDDDSDLPRAISYLTLAGTDLAEAPGAVVEHWKENGSLVPRDGAPPVPRKHDATLRGLIGHDGQDAFHLDLRTHGPHALVGGTTGAGKSEFLQAWVMGMATAHSPDRVTFLFVDYKGGSAFADCIELPHAVGMVTDLSPHLVRRALTSLRAELQYREHLLNRKKAKDLVSLERTGDPEAPPSLIIIVDEFAALAKEVPEFVDGVVDVAARGRSLGLHLVLATQRPAGVIKDNLRANTNLRIALRMADEADSKDILGDVMAAHFDPGIPGRAAAKTGPGRIATFQTGYAGGWTTDEPERARIDIVEKEFGTGDIWDVPAPPRPDRSELGPNDISRMVRTIGRASEEAGVHAPRKPWLSELAPAYDLALLPSKRTDEDLLLGVMDVPENQDQPTVSYLPDRDGNMAIYGTGGSGKSTTLRTIAISAASATARGGPVHVYGLDFGASGLQMLEELPHVGAIIAGDDEERVIRLLRTLRGVIDERAKSFAAVRAGSIAEYRELSGKSTTPRILLLVDGMAAFREAYDSSSLTKWFTTFVQIATDGRQVGVHVIVTGDRPNAVPTSLGSSIQRRLIHRMASPDDYSGFGEAKDVLDGSSPPGRAILEGHEVQVAVHGGDSNVALQSREVSELARAMRRAGVPGAPRVESLPERVELSRLQQVVDGRPVIGVGDEDLAEITLEPRGAFMVTGPVSSGRTTAVRTIATGLKALPGGMRLVRFSARRSPLTGLDLWDVEASDTERVKELASQLLATVESGNLEEGRLALVLDGVADFTGSGVENDLDRLVRACVREGQFVIGENETSTWRQAYTLAQPFKAGRRGLILQPGDTDGDSLLGTPLGRIRTADFPPGRGFLVASGRAAKLQVAQITE